MNSHQGRMLWIPASMSTSVEAKGVVLMADEVLTGEVIRKHDLFSPYGEGRSGPGLEQVIGVIDSLGLGVVFLDSGLSIVSANPAAARILRIERNLLAGKFLPALVPDPFRSKLVEKLDLALESGAEVCFDAWCPGSVGLWLRCRCQQTLEGAAVILEDITSDVRQEKSRKSRGPLRDQALQELQAIYQGAPVGLCVIDSEMRLVRVSRRLSRMIGVPVEGLIGRSFREVLPIMAEKTEETLRIVRETGRPVFNVQLTHMALSGPEKIGTIWGSFFPLTDSSGLATAACMVLEMIHGPGQARHALAFPEERHKESSGGIAQDRTMEEGTALGRAARIDFTPEARPLDYVSISRVISGVPQSPGECSAENYPLSTTQLKEILQAIVDTIPVMIVFYDRSRHVLMANREIERLTGWSLENDRGVNFLAAGLPDTDYRREMCDFIMSACGIWREFNLTTRPGGILSSSWMSLHIPGGYIIGIGIDLRLCNLCRQMGEDLAKFAAAVEQAGEGIVLMNPEGIIEYINPSMEAITGYKRFEVTGLPFSDRMLKDGHEDLCSLLAANPQGVSLCRQRRRKDGRVYDASMNITPVRDSKGRIMYYVSIVRDVSTEIMMQRQLIHLHKMEALGTLAGGIAHDLKNIFSPIMLDTEILMQDVGIEDRLYPVLDEIQKATRLGLDLVSQILTFSRSAPHQKEPVELYPVIRQFLSFLRAAMPSTIDINHRLSSRGGVVMADASQIQQVLVNLATNARHAMQGRGGVLTVGLSSVVLDESQAAEISPDLEPGPYAEIVIKDTGVGMSPDILDRIFDPFFTTRGQDGGAGMGLAVAHGIVKEHRGAISVWSAPGKGSTFRVLLPRIPEDRQRGEGKRGCKGPAGLPEDS
jgi:PAS domain S-box-containing protein